MAKCIQPFVNRDVGLTVAGHAHAFVRARAACVAPTTVVFYATD
jgi:hypothetical protein